MIGVRRQVMIMPSEKNDTLWVSLNIKVCLS